MTASDSSAKGFWDKAKTLAEVLIALVALAFTVSYNSKSHRMAEANLQLAASNTKIARSQVESALLDPLTSSDPRKRAAALYLAKVLDPEFAVEVARLYALTDTSDDVRRTARIALDGLARDASQPRVKHQAQLGKDRYDVLEELKGKDLFEKLQQADRYLAGGNRSGKEAALRLYREVLDGLSPSARFKLDQRLLENAREDDRAGHLDSSLDKYHALFLPYTSPS